MVDLSSFNLPPGFRFCPTDEDLILHFLYPRASLISSSYSDIIPLLLPLDPWQLHGKALSSENKWYFFTHKVTESPETENGFWKKSDFEEPIFSSDGGVEIGLKKFLVYYIGQPPSAIETSWIMHEYHHHSISFKSSTSFTDKFHMLSNLNKKPDCCGLVLCRVSQRKEISCQNFSIVEDDHGDDDDGTDLSCLDEMFLSLEDDYVDDDDKLIFSD